MTDDILQMVSQRTLCRTENQQRAETQTATPERMSRVRCTRSAITATPATHSTRQRATRNAHANALENTREHKNTREHTARPNKPYSCSQHGKHDDTVHHVKGDFLGALRLCWDLRLRPDHPTVVTVRLRVRQCTGLEKTYQEFADVLAVFVT